MQGYGIAFAQIDALGNGAVLAPYKLFHFPQVMLFKSLDDFTQYHGAFRKVHIVSYLKRFLNFPILSTMSATSLPRFKGKSDIVVVAYIAADDKVSQNMFWLLAKTMHPEFLFGLTNDLNLANFEQVHVPSIAVYKVVDGERTILGLGNDIDEMVVALRVAAQPLVIDMVAELHHDYLNIGTPLGYMFAGTIQERERLARFIKPLAQKYRKRICFGTVDPNRSEHIMNDLHLNIDRLPAFAIREPKANLRFPMNEPTASFEHALSDFVQEYLDGKLKPTIKSETIPPNSNYALVKVVALKYQDIVMDEGKDVFLEYYVVPCGPCEKLLPVLQALARLYDSDPMLKSKVTIGTINYDLNDTPERGIRGFPTLKLFPAGSKDASVRYLGERTLEDMADFIRDHGTHKADLSNGDERVLTPDDSEL